MPRIERRASPEQIPPLEPLSEPNGEANVLHECPSPQLGTSPPPAPKEQPTRIGQLTKELTQTLKPSLVLENKGNVARDHLASERTYLAYVRTSLATASAGVALVQLFTLSPPSKGFDLSVFAKPLGATIIVFSLIILVLGVFRYFATQTALVRGYFPVARNSITAVAFILGSLTGIVFGVLVAATRR